jgi:hypothetical protein
MSNGGVGIDNCNKIEPGQQGVTRAGMVT